MANKYRKVSFALKKELLIIVGIIVALIVATILLQLPSKEEKFVSKWQEAGSQIGVNNLYEEISLDQLDSKINSEDQVFVLFTAVNADSVELFEAVINQASAFNIDKVYIVDASAYEGNREENAELNSKLASIETKYSVTIDKLPALWCFEGSKAAKAQLQYDLVVDNNYTEAVKRVLIFGYND